MIKTYEVNFDGLVGPTHNYAGLAFGNVASMQHATEHSNPKEAALQGLEKMRLLHRLGIKQGILPPHERPNIDLLRTLGFTGTDIEILNACFKQSPELFRACYSSSAMWTANAATVSPSVDSKDKRLHFTVSNLQSLFHRAQEAEFSYKVFRKIFSDLKYFSVHPPLFSTPALGDEGAANHNRFCLDYGIPGVQMFVFGQNGFSKASLAPRRYPARQSENAQEAIARLHQLDPKKTFFVQQNPAAIDAGVFHNDVVSVANQNVFIYHEDAFWETETVIQTLTHLVDFPIFFIRVENSDLSISDAVRSYLFNSQIVTLDSGDMVLIAPEESKEQEKAHHVLNRIKEDYNPIKSIEYVDCRQSMQNGGGPACLRLRVVMTEEELKHCHSGIILSDELLQKLEKWVLMHYRDRLETTDLLDPELLQESYRALDELTNILKIGSIYPFQQS